MITTPTIVAAEQRLAELEEQRTLTSAQLTEAEAAIEPIERALADARRVYDVTLTAVAEAAPPPDPYGTWTETKPADEARAQEARQRADGMREQADHELQAALVVRTTAHQRRSYYL